MDWASFLPLALFAIRRVANRSTGFSPHELVFGRKMRGPLDLLYAGWVEEIYSEFDVDGWVESLQEKLKVLHDLTVANEELIGPVVEKEIEKMLNACINCSE